MLRHLCCLVSRSFKVGLKTHGPICSTANGKWRLILLPDSLPFNRYCYGSLRPSVQLASTALANSLQASLARANSVEEVLDVWEVNKGLTYSHSVVRSCLHHCLMAAAKNGVSHAELFKLSRFEVFWKHFLQLVPSMSANDAIMCLYNCAQYDLHHPSLANLIIEICTKKSKFIPSDSIGVLLWSLRRLDLIKDDCIRPLLSQVVDLFHSKLSAGESLKPQTVSNVLWVLVNTRNYPECLSDAVTKYLLKYMANFDFHSLSVTLWALTLAGTSLSQQVMDVAGNAAAEFLKTEKNTLNILYFCWVFASAEYYHEKFFKTLSHVIVSESLDFHLLTARFLSSVAWTSAKVSYYDPALLDAIAKLSLKKLRNFNGQDLGNIAYAYAHLNHPHATLINVITKHFTSSAKLMHDDHACFSIAWVNLMCNNHPLKLYRYMMSPDRVYGKFSTLHL